jgi:hypothetical protein
MERYCVEVDYNFFRVYDQDKKKYVGKKYKTFNGAATLQWKLEIGI